MKIITSFHKCKHPLYGTHRGMLSRCNNRNNKAYGRYGGRGIKVCKKWSGIDGFLNFVKDMGDKPTPRYSLDRINNDGDYEPTNCRWSTPLEQSLNRRLGTRNISGYSGVNWHKTANKWRVEKDCCGKRHYLGLFTNKDDAGWVANNFRHDHCNYK